MKIKGPGTQPGDGRNGIVNIEDISDEKMLLLQRVVGLGAFSSLEKWKWELVSDAFFFFPGDYF